MKEKKCCTFQTNPITRMASKFITTRMIHCVSLISVRILLGTRNTPEDFSYVWHQAYFIRQLLNKPYQRRNKRLNQVFESFLKVSRNSVWFPSKSLTQRWPKLPSKASASFFFVLTIFRWNTCLLLSLNAEWELQVGKLVLCIPSIRKQGFFLAELQNNESKWMEGINWYNF
jgi:hypothetical protein